MSLVFLSQLQAVIRQRRQAPPADGSYTAQLFAKGTPKIAQKVGEEAVELVIEALQTDNDRFRGEAADLLFHYLVLLENRGVSLDEVLAELHQRHLQKTTS